MKILKIFGALMLIYGVLCVILAPVLGKQQPRLASLLSPPYFNFEGQYFTGKIMGFSIGMDRKSIQREIYDKNIAVDVSCWNDFRAGGESLYSKSEIMEMILKNNKICLDFHDGTRVFLNMDSKHLKSVNVFFNRNEII